MSRELVTRIICLCVPFCLLDFSAASGQSRLKKKIIEYGWDVPYPDFVRDNIREMEKRPFEGIIFRTKGFDHVFDVRPWNKADLQPQLDTLAQIQWGKFTDNMLTLYAANKWNMDWYNDEHWNAITENMKLFSLAVHVGRCIGVCFDPEPYGENPWACPGRYKDKSFDQVCDQVRRRGQQFMAALQEHKSELKVLSFFFMALFPNVVDEPDPALRAQRLQRNHYALLPAFVIGMLESASPGTILIDGNESGYYHESPLEFYKDYHLIRQRAQALIPESLRKKYNTHVQAGMALYIDQTLARRTDRKITSNFLNLEQQLRFFEHNVYYTLTASDEYVWCYSERMNWWLPPEKAGPNGALPAGVEEALISARHRYDAGQPLGYEISEMIQAAREARRKAETSNSKTP
ncbi:MAG: hypothetical protein JW955_04490 [Sedimentisphaerales bacterium]|nr:hypothetical protein [Sedimentisphaerales bacterium]